MPAPSAQPTFIPQQEHKGLSQAIDAAYMDAVEYKGILMERLCTGVGMLRVYYLPFYRSFVKLFTMTCKRKEMEPCRELSDRIQRWATPTRVIDEAKCLNGIKLFDEWQAELYKNGVLSVRK